VTPPAFVKQPSQILLNLDLGLVAIDSIDSIRATTSRGVLFPKDGGFCSQCSEELPGDTDSGVGHWSEIAGEDRTPQTQVVDLKPSQQKIPNKLKRN